MVERCVTLTAIRSGMRTFGQTLNADVLVVNRYARGNLPDFIKPEVTVVGCPRLGVKHASAMLTRFPGRGSAIHNLSVDGAYIQLPSKIIENLAMGFCCFSITLQL